MRKLKNLLVFCSLNRTFGLWPKAGYTSEMKINHNLFCISLGLHYLCTNENERDND